ncbi:hypothetical protein CDL12_00417 [Handroanthus impetiginosus]|uniref:Uncharacterized protein n=1 Tax=Handroanthus impetiginosus TaxID=429701 RepID=A0A2G9IAZ1_9LAMI|nr:hypothetical protein CDL12_00417 [Handroanthus impetiginosus]
MVLVLTGCNYKDLKETDMIILSCMDLDLALRIERPPSTKYERDLEKSAMFDEDDAKLFLEELEIRFTKSEKAETSTLLPKLVSMRYKEKGKIREYIMYSSKLKELKLELSEDLLVHLVLTSFYA